MSVLKVKNGDQWDIVPAIKGDQGDPAADESITDDMLVPDGIKTEIDWLWGNQLMDIREGELLHAEDAYTAPAVDISVDGKSTQVTTTGKNLFNKDNTPRGYYNNSGEFVAGSTWVWWSVPVAEGDIIRYRNCNYCTMTHWLNGEYVDHSTQTAGTDFTVPAGVDEIRGYSNISSMTVALVTLNNSDMTYEPYSGGIASPSPNWPQGIESADDLGLEIHGKQLMDWGHPFRTGAFYYDEGIGTKFYPSSDSSVSTQIDGDNLVINIGTGWKGAVYRTPNLPSGTTCYINIPTGIHSGSGIQYGSNIYIVDKNNVVTRRPTHRASLASVSYHIILGEDEAAIVFTVGFRSSTTGTITFEKPQIELGSTATDYEPYLGRTVPLLPDGYSLRSLPDGTKDELHLSYLRPSTREGWAWYTCELNRPVGHVMLDGSESWIATSGTSYRMYVRHNDIKRMSDYTQKLLCSSLKAYVSSDYLGNGVTGISAWPEEGGYPGQNWFYVAIDGITTAAEMKQHFADNPAEVLYELVTPTTETLDPIELPVLPAPTCTIWSDPATNLKMTYIQDTNLIIENLEATIADIATS